MHKYVKGSDLRVILEKNLMNIKMEEEIKMKMVVRRLMTVLALVSLLCIQVSKVEADKVEIEPMFTYGESLNQAQYDETKRALGVASGTKEIPVHINELNGLLHDNYPYNQVYSSTYITPAKNNGEVTVEIVTPNTITEITPIQYQNAAVTAGAIDVNIKVASAVKVDGSGALAGVYKSFKDAGHELDARAVSVAQDELELTSKINQENEGKSDFSDELLNAAIAEIKTDIQTAKEEGNGHVSIEQIQVIVNNVINNYNLTNVISEENVQMIVNQMNHFSQLEFSPEQKEQLQALGERLQKDGGKLFDKAQTAWENTDKEAVKGFLQQIWDFIVSLFN